MSNNQDETTPGKEEHTKLTTNVSKADLELNLLSESDKSVELGYVDLESSLSIRDREMNSAADGYLTVIKQLKLKQLKLQPHTSLNRQVIYLY